MDTWITITQDDVLASINNSELTAALTTALASGHANPLDTLIPDVTAEVRGYVRRRNTLGQTGELPQELKNAAIDIISCSPSAAYKTTPYCGRTHVSLPC